MNNMKNVSEGKGNIRGFLGEILKELGELVGPAPVGGTTSNNNATLAMKVSKVVAQQSKRVGDLEGMFDYSNLGKAQGKGKGKNRGEEGKTSSSEMRDAVKISMRQTSKKPKTTSKGKTNEGNENNKGYEQSL